MKLTLLEKETIRMLRDKGEVSDSDIGARVSTVLKNLEKKGLINFWEYSNTKLPKLTNEGNTINI